MRLQLWNSQLKWKRTVMTFWHSSQLIDTRHSITRLFRVFYILDHLNEFDLSPEEQDILRQSVCKEHIKEAYDYILWAGGDNIYHLCHSGIGSSPPAKWVKFVFPRGQTELYFKET